MVMKRSGSAALVAAALALGAAPRSAGAFCGFYVGGAGAKLYNHATEVVLMRHGSTTVLSMRNNYDGPLEDFAMVVPVPRVIKRDQVKTLPRAIFDKVDTLGAPRLVEYWELDPCHAGDIDFADDINAGAAMPETIMVRTGGGGRGRDYHVKVEAHFSVGEYDIEVLSATESIGLDQWLRDHHYAIPAGAEPLLRPYIEQGTKWFVARVDPKKVAIDPQTKMATLSPLRFAYDSPELALPIRLGLASSPGTQDLIVNILAPGDTRYEVANYPNVTIPTNVEVKDAVRTRFGEFYAALFDRVIAAHPGAVVTEYAWAAGSCDPCPGPTLDGNDLATLGADVLAKSYREVSGFTLTRLHARYGTEIGQDLVFRAVDPIEGGRGFPDEHGLIGGEGFVHGDSNNFQGRYVILHHWDEPIACESPMRNRWVQTSAEAHGGGYRAPAASQIATNTAFAPRGKLELAAMLVHGDWPVPDARPTQSTPIHPPIAPPRPPEACGGGCAADGASGAAGALGALAVGAIVLRRRRRAPR